MHPNMQPCRCTHHANPGLACDESRMLLFTMTYSNDLIPIGDTAGVASGRLIWSHLVTEGVCVTQLTAGKTRRPAPPRTRNDPVALDS
jgi:hypothetical protein